MSPRCPGEGSCCYYWNRRYFSPLEPCPEQRVYLYTLGWKQGELRQTLPPEHILQKWGLFNHF